MRRRRGGLRHTRGGDVGEEACGGGDEEREEACNDAVIRILDGGGRRQYSATMPVRGAVSTAAERASCAWWLPVIGPRCWGVEIRGCPTSILKSEVAFVRGSSSHRLPHRHRSKRPPPRAPPFEARAGALLPPPRSVARSCRPPCHVWSHRGCPSPRVEEQRRSAAVARGGPREGPRWPSMEEHRRVYVAFAVSCSIAARGRARVISPSSAVSASPPSEYQINF